MKREFDEEYVASWEDGYRAGATELAEGVLRSLAHATDIAAAQTQLRTEFCRRWPGRFGAA